LELRILVLSATTGYQLRSFIDAARRLDVELLLATDRCHQLEDPWRDGAVAVRFHEEDASLTAILAAAARTPLDGVLALGDRPVTLAARVADALRLPGNPPDAAGASRDKATMRQRFGAAGLEVPWYANLPAGAQLAAIEHAVRYPCVVKPLALSGSRGVIRADTRAGLSAAIERVRALLARPSVRAQRTGLEDTLLVEGYIDGREYAVEALLTRGELQVLAIFDKPDPLHGPFFEETIYVTPSAAPQMTQDAIAATVARAAAALGLLHGPVHAECRVTAHGVVMLELAARPIGGLCAQVLRFEAGGATCGLEELLLMHACGTPVAGYRRETPASGVMMMPIPTRGVFKGVAGTERARSVEGIADLRITAKRDQLLEPLPEGDSYAGFIFARAASPQAVVEALRAAHASLDVQLAPELRVATT
jgi:biotin carboxylase